MVFKEENAGMGSITQSQIDSAKEKYDVLAEEFVDQVFGIEARLDRADWENQVAEKQSYLFEPKEIRKKLGYNLDEKDPPKSRICLWTSFRAI